MEINQRIFPVIKTSAPRGGDATQHIPGTDLTYDPEDVSPDGRISLIVTAHSERALKRLRAICHDTEGCKHQHTISLVHSVVAEVPLDKVAHLISRLPKTVQVSVDSAVSWPQPRDIVGWQGNASTDDDSNVFDAQGVGSGTPDKPAPPTTDPNAPDVDRAVIGLQKLHQEGVTGKGVTVAVIDSGLYPHPDFKDRILGWKDMADGKPQPYDNFGHGTHVASDIAGDGKLSNGRLAGAAPDANLVGVRITKVAEAIAGLQWVIQNKDKYNIRVVNMSLGDTASSSYKSDLWAQAAEKAVQAGLVVVVAAGNEGPDAGSIDTPGIDPNVITVGALDDKKTLDPSDDSVASFSSRGPTTPDGIVKPDILAPGVSIYGALAPHSTLDVPELPHIGNNYIAISGTSMATPLVSGVVADMLQVNPKLTPAEVKDILMKTAKHYLKDGPNAQGAGVMDPEAAVAEARARAEGKTTLSVPTPAPAPPKPAAVTASPQEEWHLAR
ncbi:MAG: S8 family peptidase [Candidatus Xenobia bacterium]